MSDIAIRAEALSKSYQIAHSTGRASYRTLQEELVRLAKTPFNRNSAENKRETFWALKDISFEVKHGEVLGIIGRNGAGKSTLLKILSRITKPTSGRADIYGRVGSLLEVGTGFHPELTGRENIFLNGAVLGMTRRDIQKHFDEIVTFAEVEQFLDTPVKRYSSGMYMRLAFAVAAHLEPEVLIVDEVLAVGDAAFQKKCLGKMEDVAKGGRTVIFVSHQMNALRKLCTSCIWLESGRVRTIGATNLIIGEYEQFYTSLKNEGFSAETRGQGTQFIGWELVDNPSGSVNVINAPGHLTWDVTIKVDQPIHNGVHGIALWNSDNQLMWAWAAYNLKFETGFVKLSYSLPDLPLRPGVYSWEVSLYEDDKLLDLWRCMPDLIIATIPLGHPSDDWSGILNMNCDFSADNMKAAVE